MRVSTASRHAERLERANRRPAGKYRRAFFAATAYDDGVLSRDDIHIALLRLASELERANETCEIAVVGGAALVMLYNARESTKDIDALILSATTTSRVWASVKQASVDLGLPEDWLNDAAKGYVHGLSLGETLFSTPSLTVTALAPHQLLAMKLSAWRDDLDIDDARLLLSHLAGSQTEIWSLVEPHVVPGRETKAYYAFCDLWEAERGAS